jgi:hypothetical protein
LSLLFERKTRLQGDLIILGDSSRSTDPEDGPGSLPPSAFPHETVLARYAFSQALSRSTALSALETSLEDYLSSMSSLPLALEKTGKPGMGRRALVKKLGELLRFRQGLNLNRENFSETPDFYWDHPVLEGKRGTDFFLSFFLIFVSPPSSSMLMMVATGYFHSLNAALEVKARTRAVNDKITYAAEVQSVIRQLLHEVRNFHQVAHCGRMTSILPDIQRSYGAHHYRTHRSRSGHRKYPPSSGRLHISSNRVGPNPPLSRNPRNITSGTRRATATLIDIQRLHTDHSYLIWYQPHLIMSSITLHDINTSLYNTAYTAQTN